MKKITLGSKEEQVPSTAILEISLLKQLYFWGYILVVEHMLCINKALGCSIPSTKAGGISNFSHPKSLQGAYAGFQVTSHL